MRQFYIILMATFALTACTTVVETNPPRSAVEELLISTAADRAVTQMHFDLPQGASVFVDAGNLAGLGSDGKYVIAAIDARLLHHGLRLAADRKSAQAILALRAGALSTDQKDFLIGIPQFKVPVPLSSSALTLPQIALYEDQDQEGVAKLAAVGYDAKSGAILGKTMGAARFGFAHNDKQTVLIFFSWRENDSLPKNEENPLSP